MIVLKFFFKSFFKVFLKLNFLNEKEKNEEEITNFKTSEGIEIY